MVGHEGGSRDLDHRTIEVANLDAKLGFHFLLHAVGDSLLVLKLLDVDGQRDHDFQMRVEAFGHQFGSGLKEGAELGLSDFGIDNAEAHATQTHHRVHFVEGVDALLDFLEADATLFGEGLLLLFGMRHELVQGRVHEAEGQRFAIQDLQRALGSVLDVRLKFGQGSHALFGGVGQDHVAQLGQRLFAVLAVEHVLDAEQADTFGAEVDGVLGIFRVVGVGADTHLAVLVDQGHKLLEQRVLGGVDHADGFGIDPTLGAVQADDITFLELLVANLHCAFLKVDLHGVATHDAALAPATSHEGGV